MSQDSRDALVSMGDPQVWLAAGRFALGCLRRRWLRVAGVTLLFVGAGAAAASLLPRSYTAESRLLVRKNYVMSALASPRRAVPLGSEAPLQSAAEFVLSRQSLESIVERQRLVERWDRERSPIHRVKDRLMERLKGPIPPEEKADAIVDLLAARIRVTAQDEVVRVRASWSDPQTVVDVTDGAVQAFLDARRRIDVQTVADTNAILSGFTEQARLRVEEERAAAVRNDWRRRTARVRAAVASPTTEPAAQIAAATEPDLLRADLEAAQKRVDDLQRRHADSVSAIEARIAERRSVLTERHPEIQALRRSLDQARVEPDGLAAARRQLADLEERTTAMGFENPVPVAGLERVAPATPSPTRVADVASRGSVDRRRDEAYAMLASGATDEVTERLALDDLAAAATEGAGTESYDGALLKSAIESYQDLRARLTNVQIELETAQAAFNYRYSVTTPARRPKEADSPNVMLVVAGALMAGLLSGSLLALVSELRARAVYSPSILIRHLAGPIEETGA